MAKKLENLTDAELDKAHRQYMADREDLIAQGREIQAERDRRAVAARLDKFTDAEKAALVQSIQAEGIESAEA